MGYGAGAALAMHGSRTMVWVETGVRVASKVGNLPSKFGHRDARPLGSRFIRYVSTYATDR